MFFLFCGQSLIIIILNKMVEIMVDNAGLKYGPYALREVRAKRIEKTFFNMEKNRPDKAKMTSFSFD